MIHFDFHLVNPFSNRWNCVLSKHGLVTENKAWEANVYKTHSILSIGFSLSLRTDHAGLRLQMGLVGYELELQFYDTRHWDRITTDPSLVTVKFYRYNKSGELVVVRTEKCYNVFEAEQLVTDDGHQHDKVEIIQLENQHATL
jgi:hypothetical protein